MKRFFKKKNDDTPAVETTTYRSSIDSKHSSYILKVDPSQGDKATEVKIIKFNRPHMRAFWMANIAHRAACLLWFSINPLILKVQESLQVDEETIWLSIVSTLAGSLFTRLASGLVVDKYGPRLPFAGILLLACIPCLCLGLVQTGWELIVVRFFLGMGGGAFVCVHTWLELMFTEENSGFIHGFSGGIGAVNGLANVCLGAICYPILTKLTGSSDLGWRLSFIPACFCVAIIATGVIFFSDDTPTGNIDKQRKSGVLQKSQTKDRENFIKVLKSPNVWVIGLQYACNFGVEIVLYNKITAYLQTNTNLGEIPVFLVAGASTGSNQILRMIGGRRSDIRHQKSGIHGRIRFQMVLVTLSGLSIFPFAIADTTVGIICSLFFLMFCLSLAQGATFSLLDVLDSDNHGSAIGVVGAIGNFVAVIFALVFVYNPFDQSLMMMGGCIMTSSILSIFLEESDQDVDSLNVIPKFTGRQQQNQRGALGGVATKSIFHTMITNHERKMLMNHFDGVDSGRDLTNKGLRLQEQGWKIHFDSTCHKCHRSLMKKDGSSDKKLLCIACDISDDNNMSNRDYDNGMFTREEGSLSFDSLSSHDSDYDEAITEKKDEILEEPSGGRRNMMDFFTGISSRALAGTGTGATATTTGDGKRKSMIAHMHLPVNLFTPGLENLPSEIQFEVDLCDLEKQVEGEGEKTEALGVVLEEDHSSFGSIQNENKEGLDGVQQGVRFDSLVAVAPSGEEEDDLSLSNLKASLSEVLKSRNIHKEVSDTEIERIIKQLSLMVED